MMSTDYARIVGYALRTRLVYHEQTLDAKCWSTKSIGPLASAAAALILGTPHSLYFREGAGVTRETS